MNLARILRNHSAILNIVSYEERERGDENLINLMGIWFIIRGK